jgi:hypothetical protein
VRRSCGRSAPAFLAAAFLLAGAASLGAQDSAAVTTAPQNSGNEDDMFGQEEKVTQANQVSSEAGDKSEFLKYDQTKIGGSVTGKLGYDSIWSPAWQGNAKLFKPDDYYLAPDVEGKVTLVAKPSTDFGVNMDFRMSWPYATTNTVGTGNADNPLTLNVDESKKTISTPNITIWSLYSKFNWHDKVYFSFGKQPLSWGVSKGYFQPADDIFAVSATIDPTDTGAEREGPISLKTTVPLSVTKNLYFYMGIPTPSSSSGSATLSSGATVPKVDPGDMRLAVKGEFGFGSTEAALAAFYSYADYPRALAMATTGVGPWNLYGEAVIKYGSERYFIKENSSVPMLGLSGEDASDRLYFTGTLGGYYTNSERYLTIALAYMYNGEAQKNVDAAEALAYYEANIDRVDRIKFGTHYAFASISKTDILPDTFGSDKLSASLIAIANLSDMSGIVMPSLTWTFFDYMSLKTGFSFNFGEAGDEYVTYGVGSDYGATEPGVALNLLLTVGTGSF